MIINSFLLTNLEKNSIENYDIYFDKNYNLIGLGCCAEKDNLFFVGNINRMSSEILDKTEYKDFLKSWLEYTEQIKEIFEFDIKKNEKEYEILIKNKELKQNIVELYPDEIETVGFLIMNRFKVRFYFIKNQNYYQYKEFQFDFKKIYDYNNILYFKKVENKENVIYSDGLLQRSRKQRFLLYSQNYIWLFDDFQSNIENIVLVKERDYRKAGKWSENIFTFKIHDGIKYVNIKQDWETGRFINKYENLNDIKKELGLEGFKDNNFFLKFLEYYFESYHRYFIYFQSLIDKFYEENKDFDKWVEIEYEHRIPTGYGKRYGKMLLIIDGEVWNFKNIDGKVMIKEKRYVSGYKGGDVYKLLINPEVEWEMMTELEWEQEQEKRKNGNKPFEDLLKNIK